jgi:DNA ligase 1
VTLVAELVRASQRVGATAARKVKVRELASLLRSLAPEEIDMGVHYLSGEIPQGKIGVGYSAAREAASTVAADVETLSIVDIDQHITELAAIRGGGSAARRAQVLKELFSRSTVAEQQFLLRLLIGELRQGALAGIMLDAIAAAAELPVAEVRRAAMYSKSLGAVAYAAMREGPGALARFQLELFSPVSPMLAQTAVDVAEALEAIHGEVAFEWKMDGARIQVHKQCSARPSRD